MHQRLTRSEVFLRLMADLQANWSSCAAESLAKWYEYSYPDDERPAFDPEMFREDWTEYRFQHDAVIAHGFRPGSEVAEKFLRGESATVIHLNNGGLLVWAY